MAVVYIQEFGYKDWSTANYDWAKEQIGGEPIDGLLAHTAGFDTDAKVFRIMDIWESREQAGQFLQECIQPLMEQGTDALPDPDNATPPIRETFYDLHDVSVPTALASGRPTV